MALGEIYLGALGSESLLTAFGRKYTEKDTYPIIREGRTTSARLVRDIVDIKKKQFVLEYEMIDGDQLAIIDAIEAIMDELSLIVYTGSSTHDHYTVLMKPIERQRILLLSPGIWGGVSVVLDEV